MADVTDAQIADMLNWQMPMSPQNPFAGQANTIPQPPQQMPPQGQMPQQPQQPMPQQQMPQQPPQQMNPMMPNRPMPPQGMQQPQPIAPPPIKPWQSTSQAQPQPQLGGQGVIPAKSTIQSTTETTKSAVQPDETIPEPLKPFWDAKESDKKAAWDKYKEMQESPYNPLNIQKQAEKEGWNFMHKNWVTNQSMRAFNQQAQEFQVARQLAVESDKDYNQAFQTYKMQMVANSQMQRSTEGIASREKIASEREQGLKQRSGGMGTAVTLENAKLRAEDAMASGDLSKAFSGISMRDNASRVMINKALDEYSKQHNVSGSDVAARKSENAAITSAARQAENRAVATERLEGSVTSLGDILERVAKKAAGSGVQITNMPLNKLRTWLSDEDLSQLKIVATEIPMQYQEAMTMAGSNAQMHEGSRVQSASYMNEDMPFGQIMTNYKLIKEIMGKNASVLKGISGKETSKIANRDKQTDSSKGPPAGTVVNGYKFKGGDPNDKKNWTKV